jgi:hypothetical protein
MKFSSGNRDNTGVLLLPTSYLPPVSYISWCIRSDSVCIEQFETYTKQTIRNHCIIAGPNGRQQLSIPVVKVDGNHTKTRDIRVSTFQPWQKMHWRSIETAYSNSPFFLYYCDHLRSIFEKKEEFLLDFNTALLESLLLLLKVTVPVTRSSDFVKEAGGVTDLRNRWSKKNPATHSAFPGYVQVFSPKFGFFPDLSVIDLIFNLGPDARSYLESLDVN